LYFVPLALINDPTLVTASIAESLHVRERAGSNLLDSVKDFLDQKRLLLVIDNFEQVSDAAPVVSELLRSGTTDEGTRDEPRPPASRCPKSNIPCRRSSSTKRSRSSKRQARRVKHDFALTGQNHAAVVEICRRLDGLPLGVELAAARMKLMTPETILRRLEDRLGLLTGGPTDVPARQRSLRGAIDWSYELLTIDEKALFATLAVFAGPFSIDAAVAVCGRFEAEALGRGRVARRQELAAARGTRKAAFGSRCSRRSASTRRSGSRKAASRMRCDGGMPTTSPTKRSGRSPPSVEPLSWRPWLSSSRSTTTCAPR